MKNEFNINMANESIDATKGLRKAQEKDYFVNQTINFLDGLKETCPEPIARLPNDCKVGGYDISQIKNHRD